MEEQHGTSRSDADQCMKQSLKFYFRDRGDEIVATLSAHPPDMDLKVYSFFQKYNDHFLWDILILW